MRAEHPLVHRTDDDATTWITVDSLLPFLEDWGLDPDAILQLLVLGVKT
jgi:hypothetical protein